MSQRGALGPKELPMLGGVPKRCPYESVPFCSCWPSLPHYRFGVPGYKARIHKKLVFLIVLISRHILKI